MRDLLTWIEHTGLGQLMRDSGPWTYAFVNVVHVVGVGALLGSVIVIDLRLLGLWRRVPLAPLSWATSRVTVAGLVIALLSGSALLATKATAYVGNPFLLIKFPAIALGLINVATLNRTRAWRERGQRELSHGEQRELAVLGGISLICWLTAVTCGRMIAYW